MAQARSIVMKTPQAGGPLLFQSVSGTETLGRLFEYEIYALAPVNNIDFKKLLGQHVSLAIELGDATLRYLDARIAKVGLVGMTRNRWRYRIVARPWTWMLTRTADCRIFQEKSVPEILKEIFADQANADYDLRLTGDHKPREYCVQYRETDFDFVSRLMEEEGIYTFFEHEDGKHTLVVCDAPSAHKSAGSVPFYPEEKAARGLTDGHEFVREWMVSSEVQTGATALRDYDFEKPTVNLLVQREKDLEYPEAGHEVFDYPGEYLQVSDGEIIARNRLEELQAPFEVVEGVGNARRISCGKTFKLTEFPRADQNKEWLVVEATITASESDYESGASEGGDYSCVFRLQPAKTAYRSPRTTPRPIVRGPQTAVVTGPAGEEIHVDKYGRIKVQFHWDRYGKLDEKSSCWMRVSQAWAGKNWGFVTNPRIGQEVIVSFLEGNPDNPIVTGRVYNAQQMPPYALPANMTQSGIKSRSSKGGGPDNFNELRFEDKKGSEMVFLHAEKDQTIEVEHDESHWVGNDRKKTVDHDENVEVKNNRTEKVGVDEKITIGSNRTEDVGADEKITIGANRTEKVAANEKIDIGANRTETVGANESVTIASNRDLTVGASETITVGSSSTETIGASVTQTVGAGYTQTIGGALTQTVAGGITITTPAAMTISAAGGITLLAPGGTKIVDFSLSQLGGQLFETYGQKVKATPINLETNAFKSEVHGIKVDMGAVFNKQAGAMLKKMGAYMLTSDSAILEKAGVKLAKAGAFLIG